MAFRIFRRLRELLDVNTTGVADGDTLVYDTATSRWVAGAGGGGGGGTPPVTYTGTDPDEAVLTLEADAAQTEHILRVYNKDGDLSVDIDFEGVLDAKQITVQDPPDTGSGTESATIMPGSFVIVRDDTARAIEVDALGLGAAFQVYANGHGAVAEIAPRADTDSALLIVESTAPTANQIEIWDHPFNNLLFAVTKGGGVIFPTADPGVAGAWWDNAGTLTRSAG